jgi:hypothetical protein
MQTHTGAFYNSPLSVIKGAPSSCGDIRTIYADLPQLSTTPRRGVALEGLCGPPGSPKSPVTRVVDGHMLLENCVIMQMVVKHMVVDAFDTCGWDPGRDPWRALCHHEDEPEDGLSDCETVFACPDSGGDGSHFDDDTDIDFVGESSG